MTKWNWMKLKIHRRCRRNFRHCPTFRVVLKQFRGNGRPATTSNRFDNIAHDSNSFGYDFDGCSDLISEKLDDSRFAFGYTYRSWTSMTRGNLNKLPLHKIEPNGYAAQVYRIFGKENACQRSCFCFFFPSFMSMDKVDRSSNCFVISSIVLLVESASNKLIRSIQNAKHTYI